MSHPDRPHPRAHGLDPPARQAARRYRRQADDRSCLAARDARPTSGRSWWRPTIRADRRRGRGGRRARHSDAGDHASGSDRIFEALGRARSRTAPRRRRQCPGRSADHRARRDPRRARAARGRRRRHRDPGGADPPRRGERRSQCRQSGRHADRAAGGCARSISPARRALGRGTSTIISGSTPIAARRSRVSSLCRPRPSNSAKGWSNCARWRPACASTSRSSTSPPLGVDTPRDLERARDGSRLEDRNERESNDRLSGRARRQFAHRLPRRLSRSEPLPCATFEDAFAASQDGAAALGMIPIENSIAGRVADIHHLLPNSGLHIVGETFPADPFSVAGRRGRAARACAASTAMSMRSASAARSSAQLRLEACHRRRHGGLGARSRRMGRPDPGLARPALAGEIYGLEDARARMSRTRRTTRRASSSCRRRRNGRRPATGRR